jgi:hypothetical protein
MSSFGSTLHWPVENFLTQKKFSHEKNLAKLKKKFTDFFENKRFRIKRIVREWPWVQLEKLRNKNIKIRI